MQMLKSLDKNLDTRISEVVKQRESDIKKLEKCRRKEVRKIEEKYKRLMDEKKDDFSRTIDAYKQEYCQKACGAVIEKLQEDYQRLQARSSLTTLSREDIEKAKEIYRLLEDARGEERERLSRLIDITTAQTVREAVQFLSKSGKEQEEINSYIGGDSINSTPTCYILVPVREDGNVELAKNLEDKLSHIIGQGKIEVDSQVLKTKGDSVCGISIQEERYNQDCDLQNGFLMYTLTQRKEGTHPKSLVDALIKKIKELQPKGFKEIGLIHMTEEINFDILKYFATHSLEEIKHAQEYVSPERAQEIMRYKRLSEIKRMMGTGKLVSDENGNIELGSIEKLVKKRRLEPSTEQKPYSRVLRPSPEYKEMTPEQAEQEALSRLEGYSIDYLGVKEVAKVLGLRSGPNDLIKRHIKYERGRKGKMLVSPGELKAFILETQYTNRGWRKD